MRFYESSLALRRAGRKPLSRDRARETVPRTCIAALDLDQERDGIVPLCASNSVASDRGRDAHYAGLTSRRTTGVDIEGVGARRARRIRYARDLGAVCGREGHES